MFYRLIIDIVMDTSYQFTIPDVQMGHTDLTLTVMRAMYLRA